jgi:hypothetical protein
MYECERGWMYEQSTTVSLSHRPNWDTPPPLPQANVSLSEKGGGGHCHLRLRRRGGIPVQTTGEKPNTLPTLWMCENKNTEASPLHCYKDYLK